MTSSKRCVSDWQRLGHMTTEKDVWVSEFSSLSLRKQASSGVFPNIRRVFKDDNQNNENIHCIPYYLRLNLEFYKVNHK